MDAVHSLLSWADDQGVEIDGIRPSAISGRGFGMVATRHLMVAEPLPVCHRVWLTR